jgi:hypothetical protein
VCRFGGSGNDATGFRWRSLYVDDPEGNTVEWVCYDETVG